MFQHLHQLTTSILESNFMMQLAITYPDTHGSTLKPLIIQLNYLLKPKLKFQALISPN